LGLLLDATDQGAPALGHLKQATELEPDNPLYALSYETVLATGGQTPVEAKPAQYASGPAAADDTRPAVSMSLSDGPDSRPPGDVSPL
jgi:hypothetical protein